MAERIELIDKNFLVNTDIDRERVVFYDVLQEPFRLYGVHMENDWFRRMPEKVAKSVSEGIFGSHTFTAGGRLRFVTDCDYIAISAEMGRVCHFSHMPIAGTGGFDVYAREGKRDIYAGSLIPPVNMTEGYQGLKQLFPDRRKRLITIHFPLYAMVKRLYIGLDENAVIERAPDYEIEKPVVCYGSSITHGACASRPGNCYENILTRRLDCDFFNLGFSGNAKGETTMAEYIAGLPMSAFVMDYDHNAPTVEHLQATHERMFRIIRKAQPDLPILIMNRPKYNRTSEEDKRYEIIRATYERAAESGDRLVWFLDGKSLMADILEDGTVDDCHPNDAGFYSMARAIEPVLREMLNL